MDRESPYAALPIPGFRTMRCDIDVSSLLNRTSIQLARAGLALKNLQPSKEPYEFK